MPELRRLTAAEASPAVLAAIRDLLVQAFDGDFSDEDWDHTTGGWHVVVADRDDVLSHAAVVRRELQVRRRRLEAGYVEGVATVPVRQGEGLGSLAMADATALIRDQFEMGALSTGGSAFYGRLGWERWQGPTSVRHGAQLVRTEEEDDGVMVLRFGPSSGIDLTDSISCEARPGDDW